MRSPKLHLLSSAILFFFLFSMFVSSGSAANQEDAAASISEAELVMGQAYEDVLDAERVDANVSGLLVQLNDAAELLSAAHMVFDGGDFDDAEVYAESANALGIEGVDEAEVLEVEAANAKVASIWINIIFSVVGISVVVIVCVLGYRFFKRRYYGWESNMKNEEEQKLRFQNYRTMFQICSLVLMLLAASPALSLVMSIPSYNERFSEFWLLGPDHITEDYPFNVSVGESHSVFVCVANQMGNSQYYRVYVKFGNVTELNLHSSESSPLPKIYEFGVFVSDKEVWEAPVTFGFQNVSILEEVMSADNATVKKPIENSVLSVKEVMVNGVVFPVDASTSWDSEKDGFYFRLSFELWRYDFASENFRFYDRVVGLRLNMTGY
jgi:hypothetical protein